MRPLPTSLSLFVALAMPAAVRAADKIGSQTGFNGPNALGNVVVAIFNLLYTFLPIVAVFYVVLSGYRYIVAQGNPDMTEKAKKSLTYAVYGLIISFAAVVTIQTVADSLGFRTGFIL